MGWDGKDGEGDEGSEDQRRIISHIFLDHHLLSYFLLSSVGTIHVLFRLINFFNR